MLLQFIVFTSQNNTFFGGQATSVFAPPLRGLPPHIGTYVLLGSPCPVPLRNFQIEARPINRVLSSHMKKCRRSCTSFLNKHKRFCTSFLKKHRRSCTSFLNKHRRSCTSFLNKQRRSCTSFLNKHRRSCTSFILCSKKTKTRIKAQHTVGSCMHVPSSSFFHHTCCKCEANHLDYHDQVVVLVVVVVVHHLQLLGLLVLVLVHLVHHHLVHLQLLGLLVVLVVLLVHLVHHHLHELHHLLGLVVLLVVVVVLAGTGAMVVLQPVPAASVPAASGTFAAFASASWLASVAAGHWHADSAASAELSWTTALNFPWYPQEKRRSLTSIFFIIQKIQTRKADIPMASSIRPLATLESC